MAATLPFAENEIRLLTALLRASAFHDRRAFCRHRQRRKPPRRLEQRQIIPRIHLHRRDVMESRARDEKAGAAGGPFISRVRTPYGSITAR